MKIFLTNEALIKLRYRLGMSQGDFGRALNIWPQNISAWERGTRKPGLESCKRIIMLAKQHGIEIDFLNIRTDLT